MTKGATEVRMSRLAARTTLNWAQKERIVELHKGGWRDSRIARQMGIPEGDVMRHLHTTGLRVVEGKDIREVKPGLPARTCVQWTDADDQRLREMTEDGKTAAEIAEATGRTKKAVDTRRFNLGIHAQRGKRPGTKHEAKPAVVAAQPIASVTQAPVPVTAVQTGPLADSLAAEIAATEARIAEMQETLAMMRTLAGRLGLAA